MSLQADTFLLRQLHSQEQAAKQLFVRFSRQERHIAKAMRYQEHRSVYGIMISYNCYTKMFDQIKPFDKAKEERRVKVGQKRVDCLV